MKKTMTAKQIAANRRNAAKSTGPRTPKGRAASKMNAMKHGILSREVLVRGLNHAENPRELAALHQRFRDDLRPVGPLEEMLVDQIVTAHWRRRRALTAEAGEIALSVDGGQDRRSTQPAPHLQWMLWEGRGDVISGMQTTALGIRVITNWLRDLRKLVEQGGEVTEAVLGAAFGGRANRLSRELGEFLGQLAQNPEGLEPQALQARVREQTLRMLDNRLSLLGWELEQREERDEKEEEARQAAAVLPSMDALEKITRYETKLERQIYRAMLQLERVQRRREGDEVPAPLAVDVPDRE